MRAGGWVIRGWVERLGLGRLRVLLSCDGYCWGYFVVSFVYYPFVYSTCIYSTYSTYSVLCLSALGLASIVTLVMAGNILMFLLLVLVVCLIPIFVDVV